MKRIIACVLFCLLLLTTFVYASSDYPVDLPYESYVYNLDGEPQIIPTPYVSNRIITGHDLGLDTFKDLSDIYYEQDKFFICDTGNNRIVITDKEFKSADIISKFEWEGAISNLSRPTGVFIRNNNIYIADSDNQRIVVFDLNELKPIKIYKKPVIELLPDDYTYKPLKVVTDIAGRMYVIASGVNQGIIQLDEKGTFTSFMGAPSVVPDFLELVWRKFATKEQKERMQKYIPTEYNSLLIDDSGFIYAASATSSLQPVSKLNSQGNNVLIESDFFGDSNYRDENGQRTKPYFIDVVVDSNGTYLALDSDKGRIYAYSEEGDLLYAFSSNGSQKGTFYSASSLELVDGDIYVTDSSKGTITVFTHTMFGSNISSALHYHNQGLYDKSEETWQIVLSQCSEYPLAVIGLAKINMQNSQYLAAMNRLKPLHEFKNYSKAYEKWRGQLIRENFSIIFIASLLMIAILIFVPKYVRSRKPVKRFMELSAVKKFRYGTYAMFHPFDGFWDIKREKRGDARTATIILIMFIFLYAVRAQFSGYIVTRTVSSEVNSLFEVAMIVLPLLFWVVSNWCFTTLMSGEGSIKDIYTSTAYALMPYAVFSIPLFILSHVLTGREAIFYEVLDKACIIWVLALIFIGMMMIHDYTPLKASLTLILSLIGICLITFILLLFINIVQDGFSFVLDIYKELSFRFY